MTFVTRLPAWLAPRVNKEVAGNVRVEYVYDDDGMIETVLVKKDSDGSWIGSSQTNSTFSITRDPGGNKNGLISVTSVGSVSDSRTYNAFGELDRYTAGTYVDYDLDASGYERDKLGRIVRRSETYPTARTWDYSYYAEGWLKEVKSGSTTLEFYDYDKNGNRYDSDSNGTTVTNTLNTASSVTSTVIDAQDRLTTYSTSGNTKTFTYTKAGDRLTRADDSGTTTYTYDAFGSLLRVVLPAGTIDYVIDGKGRRVGKKVNGTLKQQWIWSSQLRPALELDGSGNPTARFIYATHVNVPDLIVTYTSGSPSTVYRVLTDHLGSVRAIVPVSGGAAAQTFDYDAFGNVISATPSLPLPTSPTTTPGPFQAFCFAGGLYDPHTKIVRFGVRNYEPETGIWLQKDPLGFAARDANLYSYVHGSPQFQFDPDGRDAIMFDDGYHQGFGMIIPGQAPSDDPLVVRVDYACQDAGPMCLFSDGDPNSTTTSGRLSNLTRSDDKVTRYPMSDQETWEAFYRAVNELDTPYNLIGHNCRTVTRYGLGIR